MKWLVAWPRGWTNDTFVGLEWGGGGAQMIGDFAQTVVAGSGRVTSRTEDPEHIKVRVLQPPRGRSVLVVSQT